MMSMLVDLGADPTVPADNAETAMGPRTSTRGRPARFCRARCARGRADRCRSARSATRCCSSRLAVRRGRGARPTTPRIQTRPPASISTLAPRDALVYVERGFSEAVRATAAGARTPTTRPMDPRFCASSGMSDATEAANVTHGKPIVALHKWFRVAGSVGVFTAFESVSAFRSGSLERAAVDSKTAPMVIWRSGQLGLCTERPKTTKGRAKLPRATR